MTISFDQGVNTNELAAMVTDKEMALGTISPGEVVTPTVEQVSNLFSSAFVEDADWEVVNIDTADAESGVVMMNGLNRASGSHFTFRLIIEDVQPVVEG